MTDADTDDADRDGDPAGDPTDRNRLGSEASPYLQQHADNPVNWQPWDDAALAAARERDDPIFLSIGYAACHWCHVMEEESFQDASIAATLNDQFVPIKVDREERPDVDAVYMEVARMATGGGGWPLSAFLTPEGEPFYVGTYFPPEPARGQPGFRQLLEGVVDAWNDPEERAELEQRAAQWTAAVREELEAAPGAGPAAGQGDGSRPASGSTAPGETGAPSVDLGGGGTAGSDSGRALLTDAADRAVGSADREHGGFGRGQKFPHPGRIDLLLWAGRRTGDAEYREVAVETLDAMANGGLYDHLGGGFHRYCTDREWVVPHFEKMLYDNAELPRALLAGHQVTGDERYAAVAHETFAFLDRELSHPEGGFYATLDARSPPHEGYSAHDGPASDAGTADGGPDESEHGVEGAFYTWTPEEVADAVDDELTADLLCDRYAIDAVGDVEGRSVLTRHASVDELAAAHDLSAGAVEDRLERGRERLFAARAERPRPPRDEKVIAGWNGLAIRALAEASLVLDDEGAGEHHGAPVDGREVSYADRAADALAFVREHCWDAEPGVLARRYAEGPDGEPDVSGEGYLEDYAFLAAGALTLFEATGDVEHLAFARDLGTALVERCWDAADGTLYLAPAGAESLIARPQQLDDASTPSGAGVAARVLHRLAAFEAGESEGSAGTGTAFEAVLDRLLATHAETVRESPLRHVSLALAAAERDGGLLELTVAAEGRSPTPDGPPVVALPADWRRAVGDSYLPDRLLAPRPADDADLAAWLDALDLTDAPAIWAGRGASDGTPTGYVCRRACSPPLDDPADVAEWVAELSPADG